MFHMTAKFVL